MNIHHAIVKSAAAKGVILSVADDTHVIAIHPQTNVQIALDASECEDAASVNEKAKDAWALAQDVADYHDEHPTVRIRQEGDDFVAYIHASGQDHDEIARDPDFADLLVSIEEAMAENEGGVSDDTDEGDEAPTANVVPVKYKQQYAAAGHPGHCGDELAIMLNTLCHKLVSEDGKGKTLFDFDSMVAINDANGLDTAKYMVKQTRGWQGRYRMTTRNMLAKVVAKAGVLYVPDGVGGEGDRELPLSAEWCARFHKPKAPAAS